MQNINVEGDNNGDIHQTSNNLSIEETEVKMRNEAIVKQKMREERELHHFKWRVLPVCLPMIILGLTLINNPELFHDALKWVVHYFLESMPGAK